MKYLKFFSIISLQILILGILGFAGTFLADYLSSTGAFGDTYENYTNMYGTVSDVHWGMRHYWFAWTCGILVTIQIIRIVVYIANTTIDDK